MTQSRFLDSVSFWPRVRCQGITRLVIRDEVAPTEMNSLAAKIKVGNADPLEDWLLVKCGFNWVHDLRLHRMVNMRLCTILTGSSASSIVTNANIIKHLCSQNWSPTPEPMGLDQWGCQTQKVMFLHLFITFFHVLSLFFTLMELQWKKYLFCDFSTASWTATAISKRQLISCHTKWEEKQLWCCSMACRLKWSGFFPTSAQ